MKRKILKAFLIIIVSVTVLVAGAAAYVAVFLPNTGNPETLNIERTPERIERGKYLANHVAACMDCHSTRDWDTYTAPPKKENYGGGGERFDQSMGLPGVFYSKNITPYAVSNWTDGELFRAITTGVNKDGKALFPMMPYLNYGKLDKEDIYSIIAYIRTLAPAKVDVPQSEPDFPLSLIMHTIPTKAEFTKRPAETDTVSYGKYIITMAGCAECHNNEEKGFAFGGGNEMKQPAGVVRVANITPDKETGIGTWTKDMFVQRFKMYADSSNHLQKLNADDVNTVMPWTMYAGMKESDLAAIYAYLQTVQPVHNKVVKFEKKPMARL